MSTICKSFYLFTPQELLQFQEPQKSQSSAANLRTVLRAKADALTYKVLTVVCWQGVPGRLASTEAVISHRRNLEGQPE